MNKQIVVGGKKKKFGILFFTTLFFFTQSHHRHLHLYIVTFSKYKFVLKEINDVIYIVQYSYLTVAQFVSQCSSQVWRIRTQRTSTMYECNLNDSLCNQFLKVLHAQYKYHFLFLFFSFSFSLSLSNLAPGMKGSLGHSISISITLPSKS